MQKEVVSGNCAGDSFNLINSMGHSFKYETLRYYHSNSSKILEEVFSFHMKALFYGLPEEHNCILLQWLSHHVPSGYRKPPFTILIACLNHICTVSPPLRDLLIASACVSLQPLKIQSTKYQVIEYFSNGSPFPSFLFSLPFFPVVSCFSLPHFLPCPLFLSLFLI